MKRSKAKFDPRPYGLPRDYGPGMTVDGRRQARRAVLTGWFDPGRVNVLCTDTKKYVRAHKLWVDFYLKRDPELGSRYFWKDPIHKYDMIRTIMQPPVVASTATKVAMAAARGTAKTMTCVYELASLCAVARPHTSVVISELNSTRTKEEIGYIKYALEEGQHIREDFGQIAPSTRFQGDSWSELYLGLKRFNGSFITGVSAVSGHRGRHLTLGLLDDPDDGEKSKKSEWRAKFFNWLFRTWLPMFRRGSVMAWIQTVTQGSCLISYAMQKQKDKDVERASEEDEREHDPRFDDWHLDNFDLLRENEETGRTESIWPQYLTVEAYEQLLVSHGRAAALAEYRGIVVAEGAAVFHRHEYRHGFMHAIDSNGSEYMLDLKTGRRMPWPEFLSTLYKVGGGDFADSLDPQADRAGVVILGIDPDGVAYVLECYNRRCHADFLVLIALEELSRIWKPEEFGWEKAAMQAVVIRYAERCATRLRHEGFSSPIIRAIENQNVKKPRRIIGILGQLFGDDEIRFLRDKGFVDSRGERHVPVERPRVDDYRRLLAEVDDYTDRGAAGHDDAVDSLQIALRVVEHRRGDAMVRKMESPADGLDVWQEVGIDLGRNKVPPELWPEAWLRESEQEYLAKAGVLVAENTDEDPYDGYE